MTHASKTGKRKVRLEHAGPDAYAVRERDVQ